MEHQKKTRVPQDMNHTNEWRGYVNSILFSTDNQT